MTGIETKLIGSKTQIDGLQWSQDGETLTLTERAVEQRFTDKDGNVVILSGSGNSTVTINGRTWRSGGSGEPLALILTVAPSTELRLYGFAGDGALSGLDRVPFINVTSGELRVDRLTDAELRLTGAGLLRVDRAGGSLRVALDGSGELTVERAELNELDAALRGSGSVEVGGTVTSARLSVAGSGEILIEEVIEKPRVELRGSGVIEVGNW